MKNDLYLNHIFWREMEALILVFLEIFGHQFLDENITKCQDNGVVALCVAEEGVRHLIFRESVLSDRVLEADLFINLENGYFLVKVKIDFDLGFCVQIVHVADIFFLHFGFENGLQIIQFAGASEFA